MSEKNEMASALPILVVDSTGRGHAICELFTRTNPGLTVYYGPGCNLIDHPRIVSVEAIALNNPQTAIDFLANNPVEFVFVSNIDALSRGYVDCLRQHGHTVIGPDREAAQLESSKDYCKRFCQRNGLPTAHFQSFVDPAKARAYIAGLPYPCVVKTDGLCPDGDGAIVCSTSDEAMAAVDHFAALFGPQFNIVVEERLYGQEISVFALLDGENYLLFPTAADFKRAMEGNVGKNCDGMGSVAPHPAETGAVRADICHTLLDPLMLGLQRDRLDFTGFIYIGAMLTVSGLRVIEINARFGDSEAEAVLPGIRSDFRGLCQAVLAKSILGASLRTDGQIRCSVALTQGRINSGALDILPGWPFGEFSAGQNVHGIAAIDPDVADVFYANIRRGGDGLPASSGGRVMHVVGRGTSLAQAIGRAYQEVGKIHFDGLRFRADIGANLLPAPADSACITDFTEMVDTAAQG
ncbi:phosphoribosylamine--glycine ligase [Oxalobacteraceae bacterium GrIS 1.11]